MLTSHAGLLLPKKKKKKTEEKKRNKKLKLLLRCLSWSWFLSTLSRGVFQHVLLKKKRQKKKEIVFLWMIFFLSTFNRGEIRKKKTCLETTFLGWNVLVSVHFFFSLQIISKHFFCVFVFQKSIRIWKIIKNWLIWNHSFALKASTASRKDRA